MKKIHVEIGACEVNSREKSVGKKSRKSVPAKSLLINDN